MGETGMVCVATSTSEHRRGNLVVVSEVTSTLDHRYGNIYVDSTTSRGLSLPEPEGAPIMIL